MLKTISILILIFAGCLSAFAQAEKYTAPVKWERYKVSDNDVSILFPKLPVFEGRSNSCSEQASKFYAAYAEDAVFMLRIVYKSDEQPSKTCPQIEKFSENSFRANLEEIKLSQKNPSVIKLNQNASDSIKVKGDFFNYWLINDYQNKRWFELSVANKGDEDATVKKYIESFKTQKNPAGIEIGNGASRTLGDDQPTNNNSDNVAEDKATNSGNEAKESVKIVKNFPARYTDAARQAQIQGVVRLRITFLASGGIGNVIVVSDLPFGLTEQAIVAASRMFFLPARKNGIKINSVRVVEYKFSIF